MNLACKRVFAWSQTLADESSGLAFICFSSKSVALVTCNGK
jgi:hypothetical protein